MDKSMDALPNDATTIFLFGSCPAFTVTSDLPCFLRKVSPFPRSIALGLDIEIPDFQCSTFPHMINYDPKKN